MAINTSIYGESESWINAPYLGGGRMITKGANFTGGTQFSNSSTLGVGNTEGKTPHDELIDRSICTVALGTESLYCHMSYVSPSDTYTDDEETTEFFYGVNDGQRSFTTQRSFYDNNHPNFWKIYTPSTPYNYSDNTIPITDINPRKILYRLEVCPCKADGSTAPYRYTQTSDQYIYITDYDNNARNIRTDYPYIMAARLKAYIDTSATNTPSRSLLSAAEAGFGIAINREFTAIPNDDLKINYCQFRNYDGVNTIPLYGYKGYFPNAYCIVLADTEDIKSAIVDYSNERFIAHQYDSAFHELLIRQAACFGVYVQAFGGTPDTVALDDNSIILGIIDSKGVGHGDYTRGAANRDNDIWGWDSYNNSPYDWNKSTPSDKDTESHFNNVSIANFNKVWVTSYNEVKDIIREVYKALQRKPADVQTADYSADSFLSTDPINGIISIRRYPVNAVPNDNNPVYMTIGNYTSDTVQARRYINAPNSQFIDFVFSGNKRFDELFDGSFLDREPYTTAELYIPFCGTVPISVADYIGHTITVKLAIDYLSGSCTAYVLCDNTPLQSANGQIGIDVPVSGINTATVDSQLLNANLRLKESQRQQLNASTAFFTTPFSLLMSASGGGKYGVSAAAQGVGSLVSMGTNFESSWDNREAAAYELHHIQTPFKSVSAGSPLTAAMGEHCCRLTIYRPILSPDYDPETYAKTIGFACLINGTVSDFSGLTMGTIDLSGVNCSDREKELISAAFARGVIL